MKLIKREEAIESIAKRMLTREEWEKSSDAKESARYMLKDTNPIEIIQCKDCKFYTDAGTIPNKSCCGFCTKLGAVSYYGVDATDYCSFGERREL